MTLGVASFLWCLYTAGPRSVPPLSATLSSPPLPRLSYLPVSVFLFFSGVNHESEPCVVDGPFSSVVPCCRESQRERGRDEVLI